MPNWERAARFYDLQLWLERAALRVAIEMVEIDEAARVLDLGTGTGAFLRQLAGVMHVPREAVGVDSSPAMLSRVPALPSEWRLLEADAAKLPFPDRSFDVVAMSYLLHLLDPGERAAALSEVRRVLRPKGQLVVVTVGLPRHELLARALSPLFHILRRSSGVMRGLSPLDPRPDLERSGFTVRQARRVAWGYPSIVVAADLHAPGGSYRIRIDLNGEMN